MIEKKIPTEKTNPIDNIIGSQLTDERIKALENAIDRLNSEITFEVNAFTGNVAQVQSLIENATQSTSTTATDLGKLLQKYEENSSQLHSKIVTLSLLPQKNKETLLGIVPEIGQEVEKIHSKRMQGIESTLLNLQKSLAEKTESHVKILKDLSKKLQEGLNAGVSGQKESIEQVANSTIKKMHEHQIEQSKKQEEVFQKFVNHTEQEIKSVTSNHGSKFIRNTAICMILSVIAGGVSGWYINTYFPKLVTFHKSGNVTIHDSAVRVWDTEKVKNNSKKK
jgi:hypothetical protein